MTDKIRGLAHEAAITTSLTYDQAHELITKVAQEAVLAVTEWPSIEVIAQIILGDKSVAYTQGSDISPMGQAKQKAMAIGDLFKKAVLKEDVALIVTEFTVNDENFPTVHYDMLNGVTSCGKEYNDDALVIAIEDWDNVTCDACLTNMKKGISNESA